MSIERTNAAPVQRTVQRIRGWLTCAALHLYVRRAQQRSSFRAEQLYVRTLIDRLDAERTAADRLGTDARCSENYYEAVGVLRRDQPHLAEECPRWTRRCEKCRRMRDVSSAFWSPAAAKEAQEHDQKVLSTTALVGTATVLIVVSLSQLSNAITQADLSDNARGVQIGFSIAVIVGTVLLLPTIMERIAALVPARLRWPEAARDMRRHELRSVVASIVRPQRNGFWVQADRLAESGAETPDHTSPLLSSQ